MKKLLKLTVVALGLTLLSGLNTEETLASSNIKINALGKEVHSDVAPFSLNGRTMVPVRFVSEALGANVKWNGEYQTITIERPYTKELYLDLNSIMKNTMGAATYAQGGYYGASSYSVYLDVAPVVRNQRTFLPARIIAEELGYYVSWDEATNTVNITKDNRGGQTYKQYLKSLSSDPYEWSPLLKEQFEAEMIDRGYVDSVNELIYEKSGVTNGDGYYTVYVMYEGGRGQLVGVNVKTGWFHG